MVFKTVDGHLTSVFNKVEKVKTGLTLTNDEVQQLVSGFNQFNSKQDFGQDYEKFIKDVTNQDLNVSLMFQELAEQGASAKASVEGVYAAILDGNTKGFANVKSTITLFNQAQQSGADNAKAFASAVGQSNTQLGGYLSTLGTSGTATLKGYTGYLVSATAKTIGLQAATFALNLAVNALITGLGILFIKGISLAINGIKDLSNNVSKTKEKVKSLTDEFDTAISSANDNAKRIEELIDNYDKLSKGVNNLGENISLTNEEYDKYKSLTNEIADMFPNLIQGYDNEGNAILNLKGNVEQLRDAYKEAQKEAYNLLIVSGEDGNGNDIIKQWQDTQNTNFWAKLFDFGMDDVGGAISVSDAIEQLKTFEDMDIERFKELPTLLNGAIEEINGVDPLSIEELTMATSDFLQKALNITDWNISEEDFTNAKKQAKALIDTYESEIESALSGTRSLANAYLNRNDDFNQLDESSQKAASVIVNTLDEDIANQLTTMTAFSTFTDDIVNAFKNEDVQEAANSLFTLDTSSMSVGEIISEVDKYIDIIASAIGEDSDKLKIRLGFDDTSDTLERAKKMFDMQANAGMKGLQDDIDKFLGNLTLDDLNIAMQIPDLFEDGLSKASEKIADFKADPNNNISPVFDYSEYSEQVDDIVKNVDKVQSALDKLNSGETIDSKDITELANAFPDYSTKILSAANDTEKLKSVLTEIKNNAPRSLIDTLTGLKDLSEEDQQAVNGLITVLNNLNSITAVYSDTLSDLDTKQSLLSTAYKEMHDDGEISVSTYQKLISLGDDYADLISVVNGKLVINTESLRELTKEKYEHEIATLKLTKAEAMYNASVAGATGDNTSKYVQQIAEIDAQIEAKKKALDLYNNYDYTSAVKEDDPNKDEFDKLYSEKQHQLTMNQITEEEYINWLDGAYKTYFSDLTKYQDEYNKYEEEVYKYRTDRENKLFDLKIEHLEELADKSLDDKINFNSKLDEFNKKMQSEYGLGNVDLTKRPKVDMDDGSTATVLSSYDFVWQGDEENGKYVAVHYTPILPDGTVLDDKTLKDYIYGSLEGAENILNADSKGIVLKVDTDLNITDEDVKSLETGNLTPHIKEVMKACDDWDVSLHNVQEEWVELTNSIDNGTYKFDYATSQINTAITNIKQRIADIKSGKIYGDENDIKSLNDDLDNLKDKLEDIDKQKIEFEIDVISRKNDSLEKEYSKTGNETLIDDMEKNLLEEKSLIQDKIQALLDKGYGESSDIVQEWIDKENSVNDELDDIYSRRVDIIKDSIDEQLDTVDREIEQTGDTKLYQVRINILTEGINDIEKQINSYLEKGYTEDSDTIKELRKKQTDLRDDIIDTNKDAVQAQVDAYNDAIQNEIDILNEYKDAQDDIFNEKIKALEEQKKALEEQTDELEAQKEIEEKKKALIDAQRNIYKSLRLVYDGNGNWVTKPSQEALDEVDKAKDDLDETLRKQEIDAIEKQITAIEDQQEAFDDGIDKQVKALNNSADKFEKTMNKSIEVRQLLDYELIKAIGGEELADSIKNAYDEAIKVYDSDDATLVADTTNAAEQTEKSQKTNENNDTSLFNDVKKGISDFLTDLRSGSFKSMDDYADAFAQMRNVYNSMFSDTSAILDKTKMPEMGNSSYITNSTVNNNPTFNTTIQVNASGNADEIAQAVGDVVDTKIIKSFQAFYEGYYTASNKTMYGNK